MSKYTGVKDFRDFLEKAYASRWDLFQNNTNCHLYIKQAGDCDDYTEITIKTPGELILFYPYIIDHRWINPDTGLDQIYLKYSFIAKELMMFEDLNRKFGSKEFQPFRDSALTEQYNNIVKLYMDNKFTKEII